MRKPKHHSLKLERKYYLDVKLGHKKFEIRKNDRDFQVLDTVSLHEVINGASTGRVLEPKTIKYILQADDIGFGLQEGYCIINF